MTTVVIFAEPDDGRIRSTSFSYSAARNGAALDIDTTTNSFGTFGQAGNSFYTIYQFFARYIGESDPEKVVVSPHFRYTGSIINGSQARNLETYLHNWGTVINEGDWVAPPELNSLPLLALLRNVQGLAIGQAGRFGSGRLTDEVSSSGGVSTVNVTNRQRAGSVPSTEEYNQIRTSDQSGTSSDPALIYSEVSISTLDRYIGAQVQLSDGTHVFLQHNGQLYPNNTVLVRHHNGSTVTTIGTIDEGTIGSDNGRGTQHGTLTRDGSDNVYVIGRKGFTVNDISVWPFLKGTGHNWSAGSVRSGSMPGYGNSINNTVAAWHNVGQGGTIVLVISHECDDNTGIEMSYALINCASMQAGGGSQSLFRGTGSAHGAQLTDNGERAGFYNFQNETGTLMDIVAAPGTVDRGFFISTGYGHVMGDNDNLYCSRYQLAADGSSFVDVDGFYSSRGVKDGQAKARVIGVSTSQFITVTASSSAAFGITVQHRQNIGTSSQFSLLGSYEMADHNIPSMPTPSTLAISNNWDAIYDPTSNFVWIYYFDISNSRRLMRTHIDLSSGQQAADEVQVAIVGSVGSTNHAIRLHRGAKIGERVLITVANETSGGTQSSIYIIDDVNVAPTQPTLAPEANFDADTAATFQWTFNDPNAGDTQSAYQLQIERVSDGVNVVDTGKVLSATSSHLIPASTLVNQEDYRWRTKTWDQDDFESPYSNYGTFTTTNAGSVTIIDPDVDNPPDQNVSSYLIEWSVSGTTQEEYRVKMLINATNELLFDTDWVLSTDTTFLMVDIPSDTEVRFEAQVRFSGVASPPGTRLYTTSYATPPQPTISAQPAPDMGYILIGVTNPIPEGDVAQVEVNDILRRRIDSELAYTLIGTTEVDGEFRDYTALSGVEYEYAVRGRAFSGSILSDPVTSILNLHGVWIHNPIDPISSIKNYPYGNASGGLTIVIEQQSRHYAGRVYPLTDYGDNQDDVMSVSVQVIRNDPYYPNSGNLVSLIMFAETRQPLMVRDGFGRGIIGAIEGFEEGQSGPDIHTASFSVRRGYRQIQTVEV